jgi:hypothetical protein
MSIKPNVKLPGASPGGGGKSPFVDAKGKKKRLKLFIYGRFGCGKTTLALQYPNPVIIDLDGSADLYGDKFEFDRPGDTPETADDVMNSVNWLLHNKHDYKTLIIDPITIYWEMLQKKWSEIFLLRNKTGKGHKHDYYDFQMKDWNVIKSEFKAFLQKLIVLDMNVIVTARVKARYDDKLNVVGDIFDGEKSLPYLFDTIIKLEKVDGKYIATNKKDRSNKLPTTPFECSYGILESYFGKDYLEEKGTPIALATTKQVESFNSLVGALDISESQVKSSLYNYNVDTFEELTEAQATDIINKLTIAKAKKEE